MNKSAGKKLGFAPNGIELMQQGSGFLFRALCWEISEVAMKFGFSSDEMRAKGGEISFSTLLSHFKRSHLAKVSLLGRDRHLQK